MLNEKWNYKKVEDWKLNLKYNGKFIKRNVTWGPEEGTGLEDYQVFRGEIQALFFEEA